ncbi:MAG TPA: exopolysaccharide biosynthesis protein [Paracoccaceae bacterium]|nr:exopolysaccharide biosynthesis protein [Paracoccaceae bacterium]
MNDARRQQDGQTGGDTPSILDEEPESEQGAAAGHGGAGPLESLLDGMSEAGEGEGDANEISIEDIVHAFEHRSIGALVSVIALISTLPIVGGIPGVTLITATLILLIVAQSLVHKRGGLWVPGFLGRRCIARETVEKAVEKARPYIRRIDRWMHPRLVFLTHGRASRLALTIAIIVLTLTWYPLNFIPYAVSAPALAVLALGLALMTGDGYLALFGYAMAVVTVIVGAMFLTGGSGGGGGDGSLALGLFGGHGGAGSFG